MGLPPMGIRLLCMLSVSGRSLVPVPPQMRTPFIQYRVLEDPRSQIPKRSRVPDFRVQTFWDLEPEAWDLLSLLTPWLGTDILPR